MLLEKLTMLILNRWSWICEECVHDGHIFLSWISEVRGRDGHI